MLNGSGDAFVDKAARLSATYIVYRAYDVDASRRKAAAFHLRREKPCRSMSNAFAV